MVKLLQSCTRLLMLLAVFLPLAAFAQDVTVRGTVTAGDSGEPLIGASVLVKGTTRGVLTDDQGKFTISVPNDNAALVISYLGYRTTEVLLAGRTTVEVTLETEVSTAEEVIITGYTAQSRKDVTGAVSSINAKDLLAVPTTGVEQALQGRASGVTVLNEGGPGGNAYVRIRGISTINNNNPLYIIDGVPSGNGLNEINPADIENVQVLKDPSTASIYGSRASNGVVIVTTRKGRLGQPSVTFDGYYGVQSPGRYPELLNPTELMNTVIQARLNAGITDPHPQYGSPTAPTLPDFVFPAGGRAGTPEVDDSRYNRESYPIMRANKEGTDWYREVSQNAPIQNYNINASGGNQYGRYSITAGYFRQDGIQIYSAFDRYSLRINSETKVADRLTFGQNFSVSHTTRFGDLNPGRGNGIFSSAFSMPQIIPVYDIRGEQDFANDAVDLQTGWGGGKGAGLTNTGNPVAAAFRAKDNRNHRIRLLGNVYGQLELVKNLVLRSSIGIDYNSSRNTGFTIRNLEGAEVISANSLNEFFDVGRTYTWTNTIQYKFNIGNSMRFDVLGGTEAIDATYRQFGASRANFFSDEVDYRYLSAGEAAINNFGFGGESALFSVFGKVDYALLDRYLVSFTMRRDASSRFGPNNPAGIFPAVSAAWRLSDESFLQGGPFSDLKLRFGWGQTGNQNIGDYSAFSTFGPDIGTAFYDINGANTSQAVGYNATQLGNPDLKWETNTASNIGIDATVMNGRLGFVLDLWQRRTTDMLYQTPLPRTAGQLNPPFVNIGEMFNQGFDFQANFRNATGAAFTYDLALNVSRYQNEVVKLSEDIGSFINTLFNRQGNIARTQVGLPVGMFYGFVLRGDDYYTYDDETGELTFVEGDGTSPVYQNEGEVNADPAALSRFGNIADRGVGRFAFLDLNGDSVLNENDRAFTGNPHPDFTYGFNLNFGYKNFDLTIFLQGSVGNDIYNETRYFGDFFVFQSNYNRRILDSWTPSNTDAALPELNSSTVTDDARQSTYFIEDGSYLRVKNLQLGYTIPAATLAKARISRLRVYVQGQNFLTFTRYTGQDPEIPTNPFDGQADLNLGFDSGIFPIARTFLFGVQLSL